MPRFEFQTVDRAGAKEQGVREAASRGALVEALIAEGHTPLLVRERTEKPDAGRLRGSGAVDADVITLLRDLGTLLGAGLTIERALLVIQSSAGKGRRSARAGALLDAIRAGQDFATALAGAIPSLPPYVAGLVSAGEKSGTLTRVLTNLAADFARSRALRDRLISSLAYPLVLILAVVAVLAIVFQIVLPQLTPIFEEAGALIAA